MSAIAEFIEARLQDDEDIARWSVDGPARLELDWNAVMYDENGYRRETVADSSGVFIASELGRQSDHIARHDPARVMRQCAALRQVVTGEIANLEALDGEYGDGCDSDQIRAGECADRGLLDRSTGLRALASIWSDHPEFREEWKL